MEDDDSNIADLTREIITPTMLFFNSWRGIWKCAYVQPLQKIQIKHFWKIEYTVI